MLNSLGIIIIFTLCQFIACQQCSMTNSLSYLSTLNSLLSCINIQSQVTVQDFNAFTEKINLDICSSSKSKLTCDENISKFISSPDTSPILASIGQNLLQSTNITCPCISMYSKSLDDCVQIIDQYQEYCDSFGTNSNIHSRCSESIHEICNITHPTFEDMTTCMKDHMVDLREDCSNVLDAMLASLYGECINDINTLCGSTDPTHVLPCLVGNNNLLTSTCKQQLESYLSRSLPCTEDAAAFCSNHHSISAVMTCLGKRLGSGVLRQECEAMVSGLQNCQNQNQNQNQPNTNTNGNTNGNGWSPSHDYGKDKPKPGPGPGPGRGPKDPKDDGDDNGDGPDGGKDKPEPGRERGGGWFGGKPKALSRKTITTAATAAADMTSGSLGRDIHSESRSSSQIQTQTQTHSHEIEESSYVSMTTTTSTTTSTLPCWVHVRTSSESSHSHGSTSSSGDATESAMNGDDDDKDDDGLYIQTFGEQAPPRPWASEPASIGVLIILSVIGSFSLAVIGLLWYRNGKSFAGMSHTVRAFASGYGRAPNQTAFDDGYELEGRGINVVMATALIEK
eukprot:gene9750-20275_t